jgi:hypothetical protein
MSKKQQAAIRQNMDIYFPSTLLLPTIDRKYVREGVSTIRPLDLEAFQQRDNLMASECRKLVKSNVHRFSNVQLDPLPRTSLLKYENMERLFEMKTVAFRENKKDGECSLLKSFRLLNDADTSAESLSNKITLAVERKQVNDCETIK